MSKMKGNVGTKTNVNESKNKSENKAVDSCFEVSWDFLFGANPQATEPTLLASFGSVAFGFAPKKKSQETSKQLSVVLFSICASFTMVFLHHQPVCYSF